MCWTMFSFCLQTLRRRSTAVMLAGAQCHSILFSSLFFFCCCCWWWMGWAEWLSTFSSHSTQWLYVYVRVGMLCAAVWMEADNVQQRQQCSKNENKNWIKCLRSIMWNFCFISYIYIYIVCSVSLFRRSTSTSPALHPSIPLHPSPFLCRPDSGIPAACWVQTIRNGISCVIRIAVSDNDYEVVNLVGDDFRIAIQCDHQAGWGVHRRSMEKIENICQSNNK